MMIKERPTQKAWEQCKPSFRSAEASPHSQTELESTRHRFQSLLSPSLYLFLKRRALEPAEEAFHKCHFHQFLGVPLTVYGFSKTLVKVLGPNQIAPHELPAPDRT